MNQQLLRSFARTLCSFYPISWLQCLIMRRRSRVVAQFFMKTIFDHTRKRRTLSKNLNFLGSADSAKVIIFLMLVFIRPGNGLKCFVEFLTFNLLNFVFLHLEFSSYCCFLSNSRACRQSNWINNFCSELQFNILLNFFFRLGQLPLKSFSLIIIRYTNVNFFISFNSCELLVYLVQDCVHVK